MPTAVIVQARMRSSRLPGKVMKELAGQTVLAHVLRRCQAIEAADIVCCATVESSDCDPIAAEAGRLGVEVFRGSEPDVLDRYYRAAAHLGVDVVLRVTSDCPLIDPEICTEVAKLRAAEGADYATTNMPPSWPHGLDCEVFSFDWLERAAREAVKPSEREHVTPFIRNHPEARKANLAGPGGDDAAHRWTLDNADDWRFFEAIFERLPDGPAAWSFRVPLAIVRREPALAAINAGRDRFEGLKKSLLQDAAEGFADKIEP